MYDSIEWTIRQAEVEASRKSPHPLSILALWAEQKGEGIAIAPSALVAEFIKGGMIGTKMWNWSEDRWEIMTVVDDDGVCVRDETYQVGDDYKDDMEARQVKYQVLSGRKVPGSNPMPKEYESPYPRPAPPAQPPTVKELAVDKYLEDDVERQIQEEMWVQAYLAAIGANYGSDNAASIAASMVDNFSKWREVER